MLRKKVGLWGKSLSLRLDDEFGQIGVKKGDNVVATVKGDVIEIKKVVSEYRVINGEKFIVKE